MSHGTFRSTIRGQILVLDDDPGVRDTLSCVLSAEGYEVVCCADSGALMALAQKSTPTCILLDLVLPGKSGLELLADLQRDGCPAPVLTITGMGDISTAVKAMKHGAVDFIEKPFRASQLLRT